MGDVGGYSAKAVRDADKRGDEVLVECGGD